MTANYEEKERKEGKFRLAISGRTAMKPTPLFPEQSMSGPLKFFLAMGAMKIMASKILSSGARRGAGILLVCRARNIDPDTGKPSCLCGLCRADLKFSKSKALNVPLTCLSAQAPIRSGDAPRSGIGFSASSSPYFRASRM